MYKVKLRGYLVGVLLYKNLGEVIQKTLAQQIEVLRQAGKPGEKPTQQTSFTPTESAQPDGKLRKPPRRKPPAPSPRRAWQMTMHQHVYELAAEGNTQYTTAEERFGIPYMEEAFYFVLVVALQPLPQSPSVAA